MVAGLGVLLLALALAPSARALTFYHFAIKVWGKGNGSGVVKTTDYSYTPDGLIDCTVTAGVTSGSCTTDVVATTPSTWVYWTQTAATGSAACDWLLETCVTTQVNGSMYISSDFGLYVGFVLQSESLTVNITGYGSVDGSPGGLTCNPSPCLWPFDYGTAVTLTASPASGYLFHGWSGGCSGASATCRLTITADQTVTANFSLPPSPVPSLPPPARTPSASTPPGWASPGPTRVGTPVPSSIGASQPPGPPGSAIASQTLPPGAESGPPAPTATPAVVASGTPADYTPVVVAILAAGMLVAAALFFGLRGRRAGGDREP